MPHCFQGIVHRPSCWGHSLLHQNCNLLLRQTHISGVRTKEYRWSEEIRLQTFPRSIHRLLSQPGKADKPFSSLAWRVRSVRFLAFLASFDPQIGPLIVTSPLFIRIFQFWKLPRRALVSTAPIGGYFPVKLSKTNGWPIALIMLAVAGHDSWVIPFYELLDNNLTRLINVSYPQPSACQGCCRPCSAR